MWSSPIAAPRDGGKGRYPWHGGKVQLGAVPTVVPDESLARTEPFLTRNQAAQKTASLGRASWVEAALNVLAVDGIDQVRIELLARRLGITKGSFYHHFRDRDDLHSAMLDGWRNVEVAAIMMDLDRIADPRERFHRLLRIAQDDTRADLDLDVALRLWARRDARVRAALQEVDALRIRYIENILIECGLPRAAALARAELAHALLRTSDAVRPESVLEDCEAFLVKP